MAFLLHWFIGRRREYVEKVSCSRWFMCICCGPHRTEALPVVTENGHALPGERPAKLLLIMLCNKLAFLLTISNHRNISCLHFSQLINLSMHFNHTLSFQFTVINSISGHILSFASYTLSLYVSCSLPVLLPASFCVACPLAFLSLLFSCSPASLSLCYLRSHAAVHTSLIRPVALSLACVCLSFSNPLTVSLYLPLLLRSCLFFFLSLPLTSCNIVAKLSKL